jgi:molybdopterin converting factor small subunit
MRITVLLFGAERDAAGTSRAMVELTDDRRCGTLRRTLARALPAIESHLERSRFAVNGEFVVDDHELVEGDEVAVIGLVGGG